MNRGATGKYVTVSTAGGEECRAFVPDPLPPVPSLEISPRMRELHDETLLALGRLDSASTLLPDTSLFIYMYIRKEAVLSSQIEGTQSSLSDLLKFESQAQPGVPLDDVREVSNYVAAMDHGLHRLREGFPLSLRLIREIHQVLLREGRGSQKDPGEFRRSLNWIGGARPGNALYIPPPPEKVMDCMGSLELFLQDQPSKTPVLIKASLAHVQFESIHPFLDGNGRLGRLLITFLLCAEGVLNQPMLYLSLYFKQHRQQYYDLLQKVRTDGDWEEWLAFFLGGVSSTAAIAVATAKQIVHLFEIDRGRVQGLGKAAGSALRVHHMLQQKPILSIAEIVSGTGLSNPTVIACLNKLAGIGLVEELTGNRRKLLFAYRDYLRILNEGTEPL